MTPKKNKFKILIVDDDPQVLQVLYNIFEEDYITLKAESGLEAIDLATKNKDISTVVMDIKMSGMDGIVTARKVRNIIPEIPIIFHTGYPGDYLEDDIDANEKPFDYVEKGESISRLTRSVRNGVESYQLKTNNKSNINGDAFGLIGNSLAMRNICQLIKKVAASDTKVMILGETGTGKELVARAIHYNSRRKNKKLGVLNCNHKSPDIVESELFGHTKGSFTGAITDRIGLFEYADGGTVFLDEIGDLDITTQAKLLRVLESSEFQKIGSPENLTCDVRLLCATHRDLEGLVKENRFREDLYYRLKGVIIEIPPLRERTEDIPILIEKFLDRFTIEQGLTPKTFDQSAINAMIEYDWPGNVRQLLDTVETLIILSDSDIIFENDVNNYLKRDSFQSNKGSKKLSIRMRETERNIIIQTLTETNNNKVIAADLLGIDQSNLRKKIKSHSIN